MFEKRKKLGVRSLLEKHFRDIKKLDQKVRKSGSGAAADHRFLSIERDFLDRSTNERNMTRKTRSRQFHSAFQSGYCAICHIPYNSLEDHIQSKRHLKLIGEDGNFITIKEFDDSFLALDGIDALEVNDKSCDYSSYQPRRSSKMPRTRTSSMICDNNRGKESPLSPIGSDSGHHLRSRKNINYMTPPLDEDSLTEKPEVVKEYRELRSSTRLLAKLTDQMVDNDDSWNSGRPKRSCNRTRISADERLVVDNKSYYKVEVLPTKLRSGAGEKRPGTPPSDDETASRVKKLRHSELIRLNNEAENFLFPKKDDDETESNNEDEREGEERQDEQVINNEAINESETDSSIRTPDQQKVKKKRRTHAEVFLCENNKNYNIDIQGTSSRLRYQGSYLSLSGNKTKNNGETTTTMKNEVVEPINFKDSFNNSDEEIESSLNFDEYEFSFENVPKQEDWYQAFERRDTGKEKYAYLNDEHYWDPMILPYQLEYIPPLDPNDCLNQYNQIKKCLLEPSSSTSTSVTCSTPDPNSNMDAAFDDDSNKISATETSTNATNNSSQAKEVCRKTRNKRRIRGAFRAVNVGNGKNPRKSPRQHASTLAILSSLIHQRKKKGRRSGGDSANSSKNLSVIEEEKVVKSPSPSRKPQANNKSGEVDYFQMLKNFEDELAAVCDENDDEAMLKSAVDSGSGVVEEDEIDFKGPLSVEDIFNLYEKSKNVQINSKSNLPRRRLLNNTRPGRKPGKRKKNRTGWPMNRNRRNGGATSGSSSNVKRLFSQKGDEDEVTTMEEDVVVEEEDVVSEEGSNGVGAIVNSTEEDVVSIINNKDSESLIEKLEHSENNNKNDQSSCLSDVNIDDSKCDLNNSEDNNRVGGGGGGEEQEEIEEKLNVAATNDESNEIDKVLTTKVNNGSDNTNIDLEYKSIVCEQKLDKSHVDNNKGDTTTTTTTTTATAVTTSTTTSNTRSSTKRTNRGQRRMPASPKSPRMLRRPRGRWYRER